MEAYTHSGCLKKKNLFIDLLSVPHDRPDLHIPLISLVLSHYAEYNYRKSQLCDRDIFQVLSAHWLTPSERSFLWLGGMKPCIIFRFVPYDLINDDQRELIHELKEDTVERAIELNEAMRQVQDVMTVLMALTATHGHVRNGEARGNIQLRLSEMMLAVFDGAERLRRHVVTRIIEILGTAPMVRFFTSFANRNLWMHHLGLQSLQSVALSS